MAFQLAFLHLTLAHFKGHGQGHEHFDCQYFANGARYSKHCHWQQIESRMWAFDRQIYI